MQGLQLTGELLPYVGCLEAKGRGAPVSRRGVTRTAVLFELIHIDLSDQFQPAQDGSAYLIMFIDSASRWQRVYGMKPKSETTKFIKRFFSDMNGMGMPGCSRVDNGGEFTSKEFINLCDAALIRRENTAPDTPKRNGVAESAIWRAMKGGHAVRRHILSQGYVDLGSIPNVREDRRRWLASVIWASNCFNRSTTKANPSWRSPYECFFGRKPPLKVIPFFQDQEGMM